MACTAKEIFCIDAWTCFIYKVLLMFKGWLTENDNFVKNDLPPVFMFLYAI